MRKRDAKKQDDGDRDLTVPPDNRENLLRMVALKERMPDLIIVPAHDMRAFALMPKLPQASAGHVAKNKRTTK